MTGFLVRLLVVGGLTAAILLGQRGGGAGGGHAGGGHAGVAGTGPRSAGPASRPVGTARANPTPPNSAGIGLSPNAIGLSPNTIGLSPNTIGLSPNTIGLNNWSRTAGVYTGASRYTRASRYTGAGRYGGGYGGRYPNVYGNRARFGYPLGYIPFTSYYSFLGSPFYSDSGYPALSSPDYPDPNAYPIDEQPPATGGDAALGEQLAQLSAQVNDLRARLGQSEAAPPTVAPAAPPQPEPSAPPVTVVMTNGQSFQTRNFAVVGNAFWDFSNQPGRKIPVTSINLQASVKATEADGAEFPRISFSTAQ